MINVVPVFNCENHFKIHIVLRHDIQHMHLLLLLHSSSNVHNGSETEKSFGFRNANRGGQKTASFLTPSLGENCRPYNIRPCGSGTVPPTL
ncbi:hypothetical protein Trydic_g1545 [Trypoxylus dichotomus]